MPDPDHASFRLGFPVTSLTLGQVVASKAAQHGEKIFLTYLPDGSTLTHADLERRGNALAQGLLRAGVAPGAHVAIMLENRPEQLLLYIALAKLGAVAVPINTAARGQLLAYYIRHADCTAFVTDAALYAHFAEIAESVPEIARRVVLAEGDAAMPEGALAYAALEDAPAVAPEIAVKFSDLAMLLYTSGTTGPSKAIMFTHAYALLYGIDQAENYGFRAGDVIHVCLPWFHANGLLSHTFGALVADAAVALARRFSASAFWDEVVGSRATVLSLLGSMANILWSLPPRAAEHDHCVRQATVAPVPADAVAFQKRFNLRILSTYGLTDYGLGAIYRPEDPVGKLGSAGRPRRGMQIRIVDENDMQVPPGEVGEIVMRSDYAWNTSPGYYKMPEQTLAARRNFWFHTGDRGYFDADGFLFFADRKKDAIRRRGENISAFEVEQVIASHDAVQDVAVFPVASPLGEDEVAAAIVLVAGASLDFAALIAHCARNMAYFMVPRYVAYVADLPRSATHKVEKYRLRAQAEAQRDLYWDREAAGIVLRR